MPTLPLLRASLLLLALAPLSATAEGVKMSNKVPYSAGSNATEAVRKECDLERKLAAFLAEEAGVKLVEGDPGKSGRVFHAEITNVLAPGGGPWSGPKSVLVEGTLYENGNKIGSVRARRNTTRGAGTCGMLQACAAAVAKDIAGWLKAPTMDAALGDAR